MELSPLIIILSFILNSIFYFLYYEIIYNFSPIHALLSISIFSFLFVFLGYDKENINTIRTIYLIIFIFIFINLLIFLEILELNFCGLNRYTRRNIVQRERKESFALEKYGRDSNDSKFQSIRYTLRDSVRDSTEGGKSIEIDENYLLKFNNDEEEKE